MRKVCRRKYSMQPPEFYSPKVSAMVCLPRFRRGFLFIMISFKLASQPFRFKKHLLIVCYFTSFRLQ